MYTELIKDCAAIHPKEKRRPDAQNRTVNDVEEKAMSEKEKIIYTGFVAAGGGKSGCAN